MKSALYVCLMVGLCSLANSHHHPDHHGPDHHHHHHEDDHDKHNVTNVSRAKLDSAILDFGIQLYKQLAASTPPGKNIFFSPVSISATLALLSLGARSATHTKILEGLGFNLTETPESNIHEGYHSLFHALTRATDQMQIDIGQALFVNDDLKPLQKFLNDVQEFYDADMLTVNFKAPNKAEKVINDYAEKKTHGKITELVKGLDQETTMVMVNYMFFKGNWKKPFESEYTREEDFFVNNETIVKVPMMSKLGYIQYNYDPKLSCKVLKMDYKATAAALFILPDEGKFKQVEDALSGDTINKWISNLHYQTVNVHIPRFTISTTHDLKEPLNNLGIDVFSNHTDLTGITGDIDLKVSKVTHKAVLTVNEKGTEAAAATALEIIPQSSPQNFDARHPFFIVLMELGSGGTVFLGSIQNPTLS